MITSPVDRRFFRPARLKGGGVLGPLLRGQFGVVHHARVRLRTRVLHRTIDPAAFDLLVHPTAMQAERSTQAWSQ